MTENSKICSFFKAVAKTFKESKLYSVLLVIVNFFASSYAQSKTRRFLVGKKDIEENADGSVFYKILGKITEGITGFFVRVFRAVGKSYDTSIVKRVYDRYFTKPFEENYIYFLSFVCVVIFIIPHDFWSNTFGTFFAAVLFLLYAVALAGTNEKLVPGKNHKAIWFSTIVFGISLLVSCFISYDRPDSLRVLLFFITSFMLCLTIYASVKTVKALDILTGFMYGALMFTSAFAVVQSIIGVEADASLTDLELNEEMPGRVFSTLANPNNFAEFLVLFMPFALAFALSKNRGKKKIPLTLGMVLPFAAILLTYSRSGWIALAIAAIIFVALYNKRIIPVFIIFAIMAIPFIPQNILNRFLTIGNMEDSSSSYRVDIWTGCLDMLKKHWFPGIGLGTGGFAEIYPAYAVGETKVAPHSHMHFMEMLIELGLLGFVSYVCMTFTLIRRSFVAASQKVPAEIRNVAIAAAASMTGIVMIGCFEYCWFYPRVMFAFFVCAGIAMAVHRMAKQYISGK